jgi:DtxR family Mn-dependent transcriptional regulator
MGMAGDPRHRDAALTEAQEDYLKQIFLLAETGDSVSTKALATRLGVRPASVTGMLKHLDRLGLVAYRPYRGVTLTGRGRRVALEMLRHHRLLETYLVSTLGFGWDEVHAEAERLEHVISERFEARIAEALGHPTHDPHGDPIPDSALEMPEAPVGCALNSLRTGTRGRLVRVASQGSSVLERLTRCGLTPGTTVELQDRLDGVYRVIVNEQSHEVSEDIAAVLWIEEEMS